MRQLTLATGTFETHRKPPRREKFLADMEKVVPWQDLCAVIAPYYPKGENGRPPVGLCYGSRFPRLTAAVCPVNAQGDGKT